MVTQSGWIFLLKHTNHKKPHRYREMGLQPMRLFKSAKGTQSVYPRQPKPCSATSWAQSRTNQEQIAHLLATTLHHKHQEMGINSPCTSSNQLKASNLITHFNRSHAQQPHEPNLGKNQEQIARFKQDGANGHILPVSLPVDRFTNGSRLGRTR